MSLARLVITAVTVESRTRSAVARDYGITRFWVQTLVKRFEVEGEAAFEPHSRRPHTNPRAVDLEVEDQIVRLRKTLTMKGLDAGAETIAAHQPGDRSDTDPGVVVEDVADFDPGTVGEAPVGDVGLPAFVGLVGAEPSSTTTGAVSAVARPRSRGGTRSARSSRSRACSGLELLAWSVLQQFGWLCPRATGSLKAVGRAQLLLKWAEIPTDLPPSMPALAQRRGVLGDPTMQAVELAITFATRSSIHRTTSGASSGPPAKSF